MPPISEWWTLLGTTFFEDDWEDLGLGDAERSSLETDLVHDLEGGNVIKDAGGARKLRFALEGKGKSGGARVIYALYPTHQTVLLIRAYGKSGKSDLTPAEKKVIKELIEACGQRLGGNR